MRFISRVVDPKNLAAIICLLLLPGCGGTTGGGTLPENAMLKGNWHIMLASSSGANYLLDLFIQQNGTTLSASSVLLGYTCSSQSTMSGSVSGSSIQMAVTGNSGDTSTITAVFSNGSFAGSYTITVATCGLSNDTGTLSATLIPSVQGTTWSGTTQSTRYPPGATTFTGSLTDDGVGNLTGTLTFTGSSCTFLATESLSGYQTGNIVLLNDTAADGISLSGTVDGLAKNITGTYYISICNGDIGNFTMTRP